AVADQPVEHRPPAGRVSERAVNENDGGTRHDELLSARWAIGDLFAHEGISRSSRRLLERRRLDSVQRGGRAAAPGQGRDEEADRRDGDGEDLEGGREREVRDRDAGADRRQRERAVRGDEEGRQDSRPLLGRDLRDEPSKAAEEGSAEPY